MNYGADDGLVRRLGVLAIGAAVLSVVIGLSVLMGWTLNITALLTWGAGTAVAPNSAACMILAGLSLWLQRQTDNRPFPPAGKLAARASAAMVALIALLTLGEQLFRLEPGIERVLLLRPHVPSIATVHMSPITAAAFLLLGLALLGIDWRTRREHWPAQYLCLLSAIAPVFGLLGLLLGPDVSPVLLAWPTVVAFVALTAGFLCSHPSWALGGLLTRRSPGARLLRFALPGTLLALGLPGRLISKTLLSDGHFHWIEFSAVAIVTGALLAGFVTWIAFVIDRGDGEQEKLAEAPQFGQMELDTQTEEPETEARLHQWVKAAVAVGVLLTMLLSLLSWRAAQQARETVDWVVHTHEVMTVLESALRHSLDVETGGRGFAETGSVPFLEPYESGRPEVAQDLQALRLLLITPDQLQRLNVLQEQANNQVEDVEEVVATRQNTGKIPAVALFAQGKKDMDAVRITVEQMEVAERGLLALHIQRARAAQHSSTVIFASGTLMGVIFLSIAGMTVSREIGVSARARAQVKTLNAGLEQRVAQRTAAEAKLRAVLDHAVDGIITIDAQGKVETFNPACTRMFGYESQEVIGQNIKMLMTEPYRGSHDGYLARYSATGEERIIGKTGREVAGKRKDHSIFPMDLSVSVFEFGGGKHYSGIIRDITARKEAEAARDESAVELALYTRALERSNQELDAFAYAASHDLKAPLRVIHNASMWIEEDLAGNLTTEIRENMTLLRNRVRRMDKLLDDMLTYSRIGRETDSKPAEAIAGTTLIENILGLLSPPQGFIVAAASTFADIEVFRMPLQQILINLISNAIKHHDKKAGRIEVSVEDLGAMFRFRVKDDGPGIPAQYHEQIFRMFQTLKPRDQVEGSGMGLAMVRKHVDVAGGKVELESAVGQGSTFSFTWPKQDMKCETQNFSFARVEPA